MVLSFGLQWVRRYKSHQSYEIIPNFAHHDSRISSHRPHRPQQLPRGAAGRAARGVRPGGRPRAALRRRGPRRMVPARRRQQHPLHARLRRHAAHARRPDDRTARRGGRPRPRARRGRRRMGRPGGLGRRTRAVGAGEPLAHSRHRGRGSGTEHRGLRRRGERHDRVGGDVLHRDLQHADTRRFALRFRIPGQRLQAGARSSRPYASR